MFQKQSARFPVPLSKAVECCYTIYKVSYLFGLGTVGNNYEVEIYAGIVWKMNTKFTDTCK